MYFLLLALAVPAAFAANCTMVQSACAAPSEQISVSSFCSSLFTLTTATLTEGDRTVTVAPSCTPGPSFAPAQAKREPEPIAAAEEKKVQEPGCFATGGGKSAAIADCDCFAFKTHTVKTYIPTATVTGPFYLEASGSPANGLFTSFEQASGDPGYEYVFFDEEGTQNTLPWVLNQDHYLVVNKEKFVAVQLVDNDGDTPVFVTTNIDLAGGNGQPKSAPLICDINNSTCGLECKVNNDVNQYICYDSQWSINRNPEARVCSPFTPIADYVGSG